MTTKELIRSGATCLGIELGSTRIKAVLTDDHGTPLASGSHPWENRFENGFWTYSLDEIHTGLRACYTDLAKHVQEQYGVAMTKVGAMGVSAMMHGYLAFDRDHNLLTPFRTWRCTTTECAAAELTELLECNIPLRWSVAHLYQAILDREEHISRLAYINTLAGYIHFRLTGRFEVGIGEASGMFPISNGTYDPKKLALFRSRLSEHGFTQDLSSLLPQVRNAGESGAVLTEAGAAFLDESGTLECGIPVCPPEGDAGTGMVATNSVRPKTGNISAGTSIFAMLVLDQPLQRCDPDIDLVTTPDGASVAMVHCNNCCGELDAWVGLFGEFAACSGNPMDPTALYELLYRNALHSEPDCDGIISYNYLAAEPITGAQSGTSLLFRPGGTPLTLSSLMRAQLYSAFAALVLGVRRLKENEPICIEQFTAHGGLFKIEGVAQQFLADGLSVPITVMQTAGEGGAWGMALLALYMKRGNGRTLAAFLETEIFAGLSTSVLIPDPRGAAGFDAWLDTYKTALPAQYAAAKANEKENAYAG